MFPFIVTTLPGVYLITVNYGDAFVFGFLTTLLLAVGVPWLAHLPQPKPVTGWAVINDLGDKVPAWGVSWVTWPKGRQGKS